jgi:hypothetical protein
VRRANAIDGGIEESTSVHLGCRLGGRLWKKNGITIKSQTGRIELIKRIILLKRS